MPFDYALLRTQFQHNADQLEAGLARGTTFGLTDDQVRAKITALRALASGPDTDLEPHRAAIEAAVGFL